jgi:hypothetical protein
MATRLGFRWENGIFKSVNIFVFVVRLSRFSQSASTQPSLKDLLRQFSTSTMVVGVLNFLVAMVSHRTGRDFERRRDLPYGG